jgi:hypothetical protein
VFANAIDPVGAGPMAATCGSTLAGLRAMRTAIAHTRLNWLDLRSPAPPISTPTRRIRSPCCARAASGHAAAAPPSSVMNCRRLLRNSIQKIPVESMIAVSSMRVRSAHGNSFDHLVGAGEQCRWHVEAKRVLQGVKTGKAVAPS